MLDRLRNDNCTSVVDEHLARIAPQLRDIDERIEAAAASGDRSGGEMLRAMRIYLASGLLDGDFYRRSNPDLQLLTDFGLLEHFVRHGEKEGRKPNPVCWPSHSWDDIMVLFIRPPCEFEASAGEDQVALMRVKRMLGERLGREEAFECYRRIFGLSAQARIRLKPIRSLRSIADEGGGAFYEVAPAGARFGFAAPVIVGEGDQHAVEGVARAIFVGCVIDAQLHSRSALIETRHATLLDFQAFETAWSRDQLDFDPALFRASGETAWVIESGSDDIVELDEAFSLVGPHSGGLCHWLWQYLPKYVAAVRAHALPAVPVLIDADMPGSHREALALMLPEGVRLVELPYGAVARVRRLWCASNPMYMPVQRDRSREFQWDWLAAEPERFAQLIGEMARRLDRTGRPRPGDGKLFLARRGFRYRRLFNADAIEAVAAAAGFRIVDAEELDFRAQVRLVRAANMIVVPDGPALLLAMFANPGTRLCILSHPDTGGLSVLAGLLRQAEIAVTVLTGPYIRIGDEYRDGSVYQIDEDRFRSFLAGWGQPAFRKSSLPPRATRKPRIAGYVGVKDEVELVAPVIEHHRMIGFDLLVFCDANSTDGTLDILESYRADDDIRVMQIKDPDHPDYFFPDALELMRRAGIDWVVSLDADEFCIPQSGDIKECIREELDLLYIERFNVPLGPAGPRMPDLLVPESYDELLLLAEAIPDFHTYLRRHPETPWIRGMDAPKAMARPARVRTVGEGGHDIIAGDREPLRWARPADLLIAHLPLTTLERFSRKVDNIRRFLAAHDAKGSNFAIPGTTPHWRRWIELAAAGLLGEEFAHSVFDDETIARLRQQKVIRSAAEIFRGNQPRPAPRHHKSLLPA